MGPLASMPATITLTLVASPSCVVANSPLVINNPGIPTGNGGVYIGRVWAAMCAGSGPHTFTLTVTANVPPTFAGFDPDTSNNTLSANDVTTIGP